MRMGAGWLVFAFGRHSQYSQDSEVNAHGQRADDGDHVMLCVMCCDMSAHDMSWATDARHAISLDQLPKVDTKMKKNKKIKGVYILFTQTSPNFCTR